MNIIPPCSTRQEKNRYYHSKKNSFTKIRKHKRGKSMKLGQWIRAIAGTFVPISVSQGYFHHR